MDCPRCCGKTEINATRKDCESVHRYRQCLECGYKFYTAEYEVKDNKEYRRVVNERKRKDEEK